MISTERLAVLLAAARAGSFAAAADLLFQTPSAVSQQIANLEREVGTLLFERSRRGVQLTAAGHALHRHAEAVFNRLADAQAEIDALTSGAIGRLAFGSFPTATATFAASAVAVFQDRHPGVEVRFTDGEPYESIVRLKLRELDLAVVFDLESWPVYRSYAGRTVASASDIEVVDLCEDPFLVMLSPDHRLTKKRELKLDDLRHERITGSSNDCAPWGADLRRLCGAKGFQPMLEPLYSSADFQAQQAFVASGLGLSLLPSLAIVNVRDDIALRPLRGGPIRRVQVAFPAGAYRSAAVEALVAILRELVPDGTAGAAHAACITDRRPPRVHPQPERSPMPR